jgi:DNA-binding NarL/FixJ family response regulator
MSYAQNSNSSPDTLSPREQAILEFYAEGFGDSEISARLGIGRREISTLRAGAAAKLSVRIASAHPFQIREVVLAQPLDCEEI